MKILKAATALALTGSLSGCFLPPAISIASAAIDAISYVASGKSVQDHGISLLADSDCRMFRLLVLSSPCRPYKPGEKPAPPVDVAAQQGIKDFASLAEVTRPAGYKPERKPGILPNGGTGTSELAMRSSPPAGAAAVPSEPFLLAQRQDLETGGGAKSGMNHAALTPSAFVPSYHEQPLALPEAPSLAVAAGASASLASLSLPGGLVAVPADTQAAARTPSGAFAEMQLAKTQMASLDTADDLAFSGEGPNEIRIEKFGDSRGTQSIELTGPGTSGLQARELYARINQEGTLEVYRREGPALGGVVAPKHFRHLFSVAGYRNNPQAFDGILLRDQFIFAADLLGKGARKKNIGTAQSWMAAHRSG